MLYTHDLGESKKYRTVQVLDNKDGLPSWKSETTLNWQYILNHILFDMPILSDNRVGKND